MIMTVDIGGTKTLCALWDKGRLIKKDIRQTSSIREPIEFLKGHAFLSDLGRDGSAGISVRALCFALAGPIEEDNFKLTNTGQTLNFNEIRAAFPQIQRIAFLNDLEALAHGLSHLKQEDLQLFQIGAEEQAANCHRQSAASLNTAQSSTFRQNADKQGAKAVVSIGTGLGIAAITKEGIVIPSEGGHSDFAPCDTMQHALLRHLEKIYGHVSYERVLSGQGIANIYNFLTESPPMPPAKVTSKAFSGEKDALDTFRIFTRILAAACGNFAVTFKASGGIYLAGGVLPKILPLLNRQCFEEAFRNKGRFGTWLTAIPVYAIMNELAPSLGAAVYGQKLLQD